jgi:predicted alpha/beta superfamily hydrolase
MFDGQNVFGDEGSFAGGWHAHEAVGRLGVRSFARPIVIAIPNGGRARIRELGTGVEGFVGAIVKDVVPRVLDRWDVDPERIAICGSSLGGLAALWAWTAHPEVFRNAIAMSPSLWFREHRFVIPPRGRVYIDAGKRESVHMFRDAEALADRLSWLGDRVMWRPDAKGAHREKDWKRRLPKALRFVYRR